MVEQPTGQPVEGRSAMPPGSSGPGQMTNEPQRSSPEVPMDQSGGQALPACPAVGVLTLTDTLTLPFLTEVACSPIPVPASRSGPAAASLMPAAPPVAIPSPSHLATDKTPMKADFTIGKQPVWLSNPQDNPSKAAQRCHLGPRAQVRRRMNPKGRLLRSRWTRAGIRHCLPVRL